MLALRTAADMYLFFAIFLNGCIACIRQVLCLCFVCEQAGAAYLISLGLPRKDIASIKFFHHIKIVNQDGSSGAADCAGMAAVSAANSHGSPALILNCSGTKQRLE